MQSLYIYTRVFIRRVRIGSRYFIRRYIDSESSSKFGTWAPKRDVHLTQRVQVPNI